MKVEWKPISTIPDEGKFILAIYAPTNWSLYVQSIRLDKAYGPRHKELQLRYARAWDYMPEEPSQDIMNG